MSDVQFKAFVSVSYPISFAEAPFLLVSTMITDLKRAGSRDKVGFALCSGLADFKDECSLFDF